MKIILVWCFEVSSEITDISTRKKKQNLETGSSNDNF